MVGLGRGCLPACGLIILLLLAGCSFQGPPSPTSPALTPSTLTLASAPERVLARCVRVVDGDTIEVDIAGRLYEVRYLGIDTPETVHPQEPVQWTGPEATQANRALVEGRDVYLEKDVSDTDKYGRLLRYVYVADPSGQLVFVNEGQVNRVESDEYVVIENGGTATRRLAQTPGRPVRLGGTSGWGALRGTGGRPRSNTPTRTARAPSRSTS